MSAGVRKTWIIALAVLAGVALGGTRPSAAQEAVEQPPVGGLFGLFSGRRAASPTPKPSAPRPTRPPAVELQAPEPAPRATSRPEPSATEEAVPAEPTAKPKRPGPAPTETATPRPTATSRPTATPKPTHTPKPTPTDTPEPTPKPGKKGKATPTPTAEPTATPGPEEEGQMEPLGTPEPEATEEPLEGLEPASPAAPKEPTHGGGSAAPHGEGPSGKSDVQLPNVEIQGDLERPDIFFVMPRAKDLSDEQLMRARIKREITRPVIKDWVEEEMLLK